MESNRDAPIPRSRPRAFLLDRNCLTVALEPINLHCGQRASCLIRSTTNLSSPFWHAETNFVAGQSAANFTESTASNAAKFHRAVSY